MPNKINIPLEIRIETPVVIYILLKPVYNGHSHETDKSVHYCRQALV